MDILPRKRPARVVAQKTRTRPVRAALPAPIASKPLQKNRKPKFKKVAFRYGLLAFNIALLAVVGNFVLAYSQVTPRSHGVQRISAEAEASNPLDALSAADIAANIAQMAGMPEELAVENQADTIDLYLNAAVIEKEYVAKNQILSGDIKTKEDIVTHIVVDGDTIASLAATYGVTSDSIKWSNDLRTDTLRSGATLYIPPVNGIVYVVGVGDTPEKLAETYSSDARVIIAFNDAELEGLIQGERIVIPDGVKPRPVVAFRANYGYNGYWYGYCTWYVATKINVPNNWGNANRWDNNALLTQGWVVSRTPVVGAIAQSNSGPEGHVGIVEAVREDGMIKYSDMNGLAGWGRAGYSDWVPATSRFQNFIYRIQ